MSIPGGSAYGFAKDVAEGYQTVTERSFRAMNRADLDQLGFEFDRALRELRGEQPSLDDVPEIQARNRKIQRLNGALAVLRGYRQKAKR